MSKNRKLSFGASSISGAIIVVAIVGTSNFLGAHNAVEFDFTKNKMHAFSDQSVKVMQSLSSELKAEFYGDGSSKERYQPLFENYQRLSKQFKIEFIDPYKEPTRTKAAGIKKIDTLVLTYEGRSVKVDALSEEKVTNGIIKVKKASKITVCLLIGHGEASVEDVTQAGLQSLKAALEDQSYEVKELSFPQKEISNECSSILMLGSHGKFFPAEIKTLSDYLNRGGRAAIAVGAALSSKDEPSPEFRSLLNTWGIVIKNGLVVDPQAKKLGVDASLVLVTLFNPHHPATREAPQLSYLPFTRPIDFTPTVPSNFKVESVAKTGDDAWAETDIKSFIKGTATFNASSDTQGPVSVTVATSGKQPGSNAAKETRLVVFGSSQFVNNQYARLGGNLDFFMNAVSWILEDESLISIRTKDQEQGKVELSEAEDITVFWLLVVIIPAAAALMGLLVWLQRKKL